MPETQNGIRARVDRLERDEREARERRDQYARDNANDHRRIHERIEANRERLTRLEVQADERHREIREDIHDCADKVVTAEKRLVDKVDAVENRVKAEIGVLRGEVRKTREGTLTQKVAYIAAAGAVLSAAIYAIAQIVAQLSGG